MMNDLPMPVSPGLPEPAANREPLIRPVYVVIGVVVTLVVAALSVALLVYLAINYAETILIVRDIFIIALGLMLSLIHI